MKTALITGATSGIGEAAAERLASEHYRLIITGRREERLLKVAEYLQTTYRADVLPLCFDVCSLEQVRENLGGLPEGWRQVSALVNNAGLAAGLEPLDAGRPEDWQRMIDTNIKGLLYVTRTIAPLMIARREGHIINVGSIAGREVYANGNVYCATKHAVDALTESMRMEFSPYGIRVSQVAPGAVETEFSIVRFKGDRQRADAVYQGFRPLKAADIADVIAYMMNCPPHVNIADVLVLPAAQAAATMIHRAEVSRQS
ncbi:MAG: SDR family NAD(P)-dependent oxidoreductase [Prevotellaceae bacterium]|jgi:NADP-dependent 3-hydroxy acid dehydrogenase YdfG|nr:SDR family NAD(P)-dependent oxidoreductase [Prevotellaceae bacterium]